MRGQNIFTGYKRLWIGGGLYVVVMGCLATLVVGISHIGSLQDYSSKMYANSQDLSEELQQTQSKLASTSAALQTALNEDQRVKNQTLEAEIKAIEVTYNQVVVDYEAIIDLRSTGDKTTAFDDSFAKALKLLADRNYASAGAKLTQLKKDTDAEKQKLVDTFSVPANVPVNNAPPGSGYSRQQVVTDAGTFMVSLIAADLNSTRVVVDTASGGTCGNDCPVLPLDNYVSRSGAFAGINGPYFCPSTYPSCVGKTNSFDTLLMNKNKVYFNSDNNVYSVVPAVIFQGSGARFVGKSLEWGRDTGPDSVIASQPFLVSDGNVVCNGCGDAKQGTRGPKGFIGVTNSTVYIGIVSNASMGESAKTLQKLGIKNAINLDGGGSTALWYGGYKLGPGRALPFGILFVRK